MDGKDMGMDSGKTCNCPHHKVIPVLVILLGVAFLAANLNLITWSVVGWIWPVLVVIAGGTMLFRGSCKCCSK